MPAEIKDTPSPDANGHRTTSSSNGTEWVLVYDAGVELVQYLKNKDNQTTSMFIIETFNSPAHAETRIGELGFTVPSGTPPWVS